METRGRAHVLLACLVHFTDFLFFLSDCCVCVLTEVGGRGLHCVTFILV